MNILDENILKSQRELLEGRHVAVRQIGVNVGRKGMLDEDIIPLLQQLNFPTFFTRDDDFYKRALAHDLYCLVYLAVEKSEVAWFVRRLLRHPGFRTKAGRMGKVIRISHTGIAYWQRHQIKEQQVEWK